MVFISLSIASKVSQHWMSYNATSKEEPFKISLPYGATPSWLQGQMITLA